MEEIISKFEYDREVLRVCNKISEYAIKELSAFPGGLAGLSKLRSISSEFNPSSDIVAKCVYAFGLSESVVREQLFGRRGGACLT